MCGVHDWESKIEQPSRFKKKRATTLLERVYMDSYSSAIPSFEGHNHAIAKLYSLMMRAGTGGYMGSNPRMKHMMWSSAGTATLRTFEQDIH